MGGGRSAIALLGLPSLRESGGQRFSANQYHWKLVCREAREDALFGSPNRWLDRATRVPGTCMKDLGSLIPTLQAQTAQDEKATHRVLDANTSGSSGALHRTAAPAEGIC